MTREGGRGHCRSPELWVWPRTQDPGKSSERSEVELSYKKLKRYRLGWENGLVKLEGPETGWETSKGQRLDSLRETTGRPLVADLWCHRPLFWQIWPLAPDAVIFAELTWHVYGLPLYSVWFLLLNSYKLQAGNEKRWFRKRKVVKKGTSKILFLNFF